MINTKLIWALGIIYAVTQLILNATVISLQLDARANRAITRSQNNFIVCILQIQPDERDPASIKKCRDENIK